MISTRTRLAAAGALLVVAGAAGCTGETSPPAGAPNVIVITLDTTRVDRFGSYGNADGLTPNFDAFAAEGVQFDRAIAQASTTPVSHASIFTGLDPHRHGLRVIYAASGARLPPDVPVLAELFADAGWSTAAFLSSFTVSEYYGLDRGFEAFDNGLYGEVGRKFELDEATGNSDWDRQTNQRRSDTTTDEAILWLREQPRDRPFLLWVHYWDPHDVAFVPPDAFMRGFDGRGLSAMDGRRLMYDAETSYVDRQFGALVEELRELDEYDNSVVVVLADHGEGLWDHGWFGHRILYQEQIHIPLLIRGPGLPAGRRVPQLVRSTDLLPTLTELAGLDTPADLDGRSLLETVRGENAAPRVAIAEALNRFDLNAVGVHRPADEILHAVIDGDWKLIYRPLLSARSELYNLADDPGEQTNLLAADPGRARELLRTLEASGSMAYEEFGEGQDPEALERLRSLGYAGGGD